MKTIHADVQHTRRKQFCHVFAEDGETLLYSSRSLMQCIEWVLDQGDKGFLLDNQRSCLSLVHCDCQH